MHGTGNDFILLENLKELSFDYPRLAGTWCDRHFGIGADGLILILPSKKADFQMRIFNADGSEAESCGNGVRCFARHVYERKFVSEPCFTVETLGGMIRAECFLENGKVKEVRVNMGLPRYGNLHPDSGKPLHWKAVDLEIPLKLHSGKAVKGASISMGNPHFVIFSDNPDLQMEQEGKELSFHPAHPDQSNVEFVEIFEKNKLRVRVWERGVGPTLACGTGACASLVAARILKNFPAEAQVELPGGKLKIEWNGEGPVYLTGPATYVFQAETLEVPAETGRTTAQP